LFIHQDLIFNGSKAIQKSKIPIEVLKFIFIQVKIHDVQMKMLPATHKMTLYRTASSRPFASRKVIDEAKYFIHFQTYILDEDDTESGL
jgi:hypothetical protein